MKTTQSLAGVSVATVLAFVAPAYAGILGGAATGALGGTWGGGMSNPGRLGGLSSQGEFDGRALASTSVDRANARRASGAVKQAAAPIDSAAKSTSSAKPASSATPKDAAPAAKPAATPPRVETSADASANASGSVSKNP